MQPITLESHDFTQHMPTWNTFHDPQLTAEALHAELQKLSGYDLSFSKVAQKLNAALRTYATSSARGTLTVFADNNAIVAGHDPNHVTIWLYISTGRGNALRSVALTRPFGQTVSAETLPHITGYFRTIAAFLRGDEDWQQIVEPLELSTDTTDLPASDDPQRAPSSDQMTQELTKRVAQLERELASARHAGDFLTRVALGHDIEASHALDRWGARNEIDSNVSTDEDDDGNLHILIEGVQRHEGELVPKFQKGMVRRKVVVWIETQSDELPHQPSNDDLLKAWEKGVCARPGTDYMVQGTRVVIWELLDDVDADLEG